MPLMRDVLDPATVKLLDEVAPDVEVEVEIPAFAQISVAAFADWVNQLNSAACDALTEAHVGDPFDLCAAWEAYNGCPIAVLTTVINPPMPAVKPVEVVQQVRPSRCQTLNVDGKAADVPTPPDPPRWLSCYAYWRGAAEVWQRGQREADASRCSLAATMFALRSSIPTVPLLSYKGVLQ